MSTINQIQLPNGSIYGFEDIEAREAASSKADKTLATTSTNGLMSAADKSKLDGIGAGSNVKSVNGKTGAVTLSKADVGLGNVDNTSDANKAVFESRLRWGGTNIAGDISPIDAAMSNIHSANRAAFANPAGIIVEFSNDGGSTWADYGASDTSKIQLVSGIDTTYFIGKHTTNNTVTVNDKLRITVNASNCGFYTALKKILIYVSTNGAGGAYVELQKSYKGTETSWSSSERYSISGWSGWNSIPCSGSFGGGSNQTGNMANIRLTFGITSKGSSSCINSLSVQALQFLGTTYWGYHSEMAKSGHLYSYDAEQNAKFPAQITAKQFNGTATNASKVNNHTVNSDVPSGAKFTDTTYSAATTSADGLMSKSDKSKLDGIGAGSNVKSVNSKTGAVTLTKSDIGLSNVDNTADSAKSVKYATSAGSAGSADTVDGFHEYSFLRYRDNTSTNGAETLWNQIGIREYDNALPSDLSGLYSYGAVVSLPSSNVRFDLYYNHQASANGDGLYYRTGWGTDKKGWVHLIDSQSIGSQSVNYANSAGSVAWGNVSGKPSTYPPSSHTHTPAQVGLGSVANLDQSKAIKSITRSGTTFTATALDGTTTTFTQQDSNTTYNNFKGATTATAGGNGLVPAPTTAQVGFYLRGDGTWHSPSDVKANNAGYADSAGKATNDSAGNNINNTYIKSLSVSGRVITYTKGNGATGSFQTQDTNTNTTYSAGTGLTLSGTTFSINAGASTVAYATNAGNGISNITRSGTTFTVTRQNGSTFSFNQQDTNTTYGLASQSSNGLMSAADKSKLNGIGAGSNVKSVNGKTGAVTISKADVGLGNVDNTRDADKPYYKLIGKTESGDQIGHFKFNDARRSLYKIKNFYAASGEGDHFYLAHKKLDYTITATKHFSNIAGLFTADLTDDCTIATDLISESDPAILTIVRKDNNPIANADDLSLIFYEDAVLADPDLIGHSIAKLKHWKLETMVVAPTTDYLSPATWKWETVFERSYVSDNINCLCCGLGYGPIKGIRITIYAATPTTTSWEFEYSKLLKIAGMRLLDSRPLFSPAEALGALDVAGGTVYGETTFQEGISATSYSGATATSSADGLMSKADKAKLDTLANDYYVKTPQNLPSGFNSTDRASMNHLKNGWYWHSGGDGTLNFPNEWGFMIKFGFENDGDFSALYFTQMSGTIYRCSGNANGISGWVAI